MSSTVRATPGRPAVTSHEAIEKHAFALFEEQGFEATTVEEIVASAGIGRRTFFRYFPSKADVAWGRFDDGLDAMRQHLWGLPTDLSMLDAIHSAILEFNRFPSEAMDQHRRRMRLILSTPALQAHSAIRYADWRHVISEFVAEREGLEVDDLLPRVVGHVSLAVALSAYEQWLAEGATAELEPLLNEAVGGLRLYLMANGFATPGSAQLSAG